MNYQEALQGITKYTPSQFNTLFDNYAEAALSWDKKDVVTKIVCRLKLDLPCITDEGSAYAVLESTLAFLLHSGLILSKPFGYSALGAEEVRELLLKYPTEGQVM